MTTPFPIKSIGVPEGTGANGVLVLGEAPGEHEEHVGTPFVKSAPAGAVLERAIKRCGYAREQFVLWNTVPARPPKNYLEGAPYEAEAVEWGREWVDKVVREYKPRCILALGNVALRSLTGLAGRHRSVSALRGYALPTRYGIPVIGSFHPSFLRRGGMPLLSVLMHDIKLAVAVAHGAPTRFFSPVVWRDWEYVPQPTFDMYTPVVPPGYITHPTEGDAWEFLEEARDAKLVAYDIETPYSSNTSEDETDELEDRTILSIQFSTGVGTGIYLPWQPPFDGIARSVLALPGEKVGANSWRFDDPILRAHGAELNGRRHDVRWAFHHLQPDLRGSLQFIASFYANEMGPWKHLSEFAPQVYGIRDVDVLMRIMT